mgnify:CR=1 FL=1
MSDASAALKFRTDQAPCASKMPVSAVMPPVAGAERDTASLRPRCRRRDTDLPGRTSKSVDSTLRRRPSSAVGPVRMQMEALVGALCGKLLFPGLLRQRW